MQLKDANVLNASFYCGFLCRFKVSVEGSKINKLLENVVGSFAAVPALNQ